MDGDFKGDFSRDSFNFLQPFSRVLMQQGRVQLDADWNEQADSLLYYLRTLAMNVIGPAGGRGNSFVIDHIKDDGTTQPAADFTIGAGHYYVDGILCANDAVDKDGEPVKFIKYTDQLYFQDLSELTQGKAGNFLVYLDVWERQVTALENNDIREVALGPGGPDTATRGEIVWQVQVIRTDVIEQAIKNSQFRDSDTISNKIEKPDAGSPLTIDEFNEVKAALTEYLQSKSRGRLIASTNDNPDTPPDPCTVSPDAKFRGEENQLYRVEIHTGGTPVAVSSSSTQSKGTASARGRKKSQQLGSEADGPTFKWSRENGSVVFAIFDNISIVDGTITISLDNLGRDDSRFTLAKGDWVELLTLSSSLTQTPGQMLRVSKVDYTSMQVVLTFPEGTVAPSIAASDTVPPFLLRRWDFHGGDPKQGGLTIARDGAAKIIEGDKPLQLEYGIQITFTRTSQSTDQSDAYRTGDYWLIPARTATGAIQWPRNDTGPLALLPKGIAHHYAPLALVTLTGDGTIEAKSDNITDLRSTFKWLTELSHS